MKYNIKDLYFAKCRHCIMDIYMSYIQDGKEITPRPDYVDYYTILLLKNENYINIYDKNIKYNNNLKSKEEYEHYCEDIILYIDNLSNYIDIDSKKITKKEAIMVDNTIKKCKNLKIKYGYKK